MIFRHRKICLAYMQCWGLLEGSRNVKDQLWLRAIQQTEDYYSHQTGSLSSIVFDLHFRHKMTKVETLQHGHMSNTTYEKAVTDILSTLAVFAAQMGILPTYNEKEATK